MASNLRVQKADYFTPQLKRGIELHEALRDSSKVGSQLLIQSRVQRGTTQSRARMDHHLASLKKSYLIPRETSRFIMPSNLELPIQSKVVQSQPNYPTSSTILSKHKKIEETSSTKDGSACNQSTFSEQQSQNATAHVKEINETFKNLVYQNIKAPTQRMGYNHTYEERRLAGEIWVSQPKDIPRRVFEVKQDLQQGSQNNEEVNCLQGFLNKLGLFYFLIGNTLLFFDAENINLESIEIFTMEISKNPLIGLLGIQVFVLGQPYFCSKKDVMIFLQPYTGQIYDYSLKIDLQSGKRILNLKFRESFPLPHQRPHKLVKSSKGILYCVDDKGGIFKIDFSQSFWEYQKRQLAAQRFRKSALTAVKNTTKFFTQSLRIFAKCIKNYTFSFFSTRPVEVQLLFDETKEIIVVFIKEENRAKDGTRKIVQYFHIYDEKSSELLYILRGDDCSIKDEEIVIFRKLEQHSNSKYNFVLLLKSGKRILLEVHNDRLRKSATVKAPPSNTGDSSIKVQDQPAASPYDNICFLRQDMMGIMISTNYYYLVLTRPGYNETESVSYVRVESGQFCNIYHRTNDPFGYRKRCLLQKQKKSEEATLPQFSRQVFYKPQELYYATDQTIQKIKILRPIDIFYSIFQTYSQNVPRFFKAIQQMLPEADSQALLSFCCQLLVDSQGSYLLSRQFQQQVNNRPTRQSSSNWSVFQLENHSFKDIDRKNREKLLGIMVDIAINAGKAEKQEKQKLVVEGSLLYYSKLLQTIFLTNINTLTSELCKIMGYLLQEYSKFLQELKRHLKCDTKSYLGKAMRWTNRFWQLMILCKDIPNLPDLRIDEALVQNPECFDKFIFQFLVKECKEQVFGQIKKLMPAFITERFTNVYRLYCEIVTVKDASKVLEICKNYTQLPDYFIDYLIKSKGIPEAALLRDIKPPEKQPEVIVTYQEKMKDFYSKRTTLYEKEQILLHAIILLKQAPENAKIGEQVEANTLLGQLKLQELIIETYHHRLINKPLWVKILSCLVPDTQSRGQEKEVMEKLNTCLLDPVLLGDVVENLNDALLKVMYAYYLKPQSFERLFFSLAENLFEQSQGSLAKLSEAFTEELHFMLSKAKLALQFQETMIIIDTFITLLTQCKDLEELMGSSKGLLKRQTFWPLGYCAELGIDANRLYNWAVGRLSDYGPQKLPYLQLCLAHLVRDFLPIKRNELSRILNCEQSEEVFLKQISVLLS